MKKGISTPWTPKRCATHHHGELGIAGKPVFELEHQTRPAVPFPERRGSGQSQPFLGLYKVWGRKPDHRVCGGGSGKTDLPGIPGRCEPAPDQAWLGSGRYPYWGCENEEASVNTEENPAE